MRCRDRSATPSSRVRGVAAVFLVAVPFSVVGLVLVVFLKETPLRTSTSDDAAEPQVLDVSFRGGGGRNDLATTQKPAPSMTSEVPCSPAPSAH
jgi:hypothetical protein